MKKNLFLFMFIGLFIFAACNKDDDEGNKAPTPEESKTTISNLDTDLSSDINEITSSEGIDAVFSAMNVMQAADPFSKQKKSTAGFAFSENCGTYSWSESLQDWEYSSTPTDKMIFEFPADTLAPNNNNAVATITSLSFKEIIDEYEEWDYNLQQYVMVKDTDEIPTSIVGSVTIDGSEIMSIDYTGSFDAHGDPTSIDASVTMDIVEATVVFTKSTTQYDVDESLSLSGEKIHSAGVTAKYAIRTDSWGDTYDSVYQVSGYFHYGDIKVKGSMDIGELDKFDDETNPPTIDDINANIDLGIYSYPGEDLMCDIVFYDYGDTTITPIKVVYTDDTEQKFDDFAQDILDVINNEIVTEFGGADAEPMDLNINYSSK